MNPKIQKLRAELEKNTDKIRKLQVRNTEIKQQLRELEDTDIIGMVRAKGLTIEEFAAFIGQLQSSSEPDNKEDSPIEN